MAGFFRKVEQKVQLKEVDGGKLCKEKVLRFEETGGKHHKEEVVHYKEDLLDRNYGGEIGYQNQLIKGDQYDSGLVKKIKQRMDKKKDKINGRKGARDHRDDNSSDDDYY